MAFGLGALLGGLGKVGKGLFGGIKKMPGILGDGEESRGNPLQIPGMISEEPQTLFDKFRTPDFNPNIQQRRKPAPIMAPAPRPSMPTSVPDADIPGGRLPVGPIAGPRSRAEEMQEARDVYRSGPVPQGFGARLKSAIVPAITGAVRGYAQTGDAGGAIGGLLGGGGIAALSPKTQRAMDFEQQIKPQILERYGLEDQQAQADAAARREALDQEYRRAQLNEMLGKGRREDAQSQLERDKFEFEKTKPGVPSYMDLDDGSGQLWRVARYPDGREEWIGRAGSQTLQGDRLESQQKIATDRNVAQMQREQYRQGQIGARRKSGGGGTKTAKPPRAGSQGTITKDEFNQLMQAPEHKGLTRAQVRTKYRQLGYIPPEF